MSDWFEMGDNNFTYLFTLMKKWLALFVERMQQVVTWLDGQKAKADEINKETEGE
jgi:hypothetical protein